MVDEMFKLIGVDVIEESWLKEVVKLFVVDIVVTKEWVEAVGDM